MNRLPASWALCTIADVTAPVQTIDTARSNDRDILYVDISSIDNLTNRIAEPKQLRLSSAPSRARQILKSGDVLFATVRPYLRNIAQVPESLDGEIASTGFAVLRAVDGVVPSYLFYKSISRDFVAALTGEQYGVSYPAVKDDQVRAQPFELPPTSEQRRIVSKIEELFSELDKGVESLTTAREQLKAYRQAVLKHAFEGKLTADWRETNRTRSESIQQRTEKLEHSRRKAWNDPKNTFRRGKYKPPAPYDDEDVPQVPNDWALVSMDALTFHTTSGSRDWSQYYDRGDATFIMAQNVRPALYDPSFTQKIDPPINGADSERTRAALDDLLVTIVGANTGNLCRFDIDSTSHYVCQSVALMRPVFPELARFLELYFQAETGGLRQYKRYIYGAGRPHLSFDQIKQTVAPLPDLQEAQLIVERVSASFSQIEALEDTLDDEVARADVLRQAILKKAFSGQLVAQNPKDETASVLLQRIRAEKEDGDNGRKKNNKNGKKEAA
ncbi:restriction endonuclease subunit S [Bradyrhizobium japonicum]|uniref:restriction endonuclease subunit S n=1 Tax=Bradyrhizobium japonicum TaxID=375 RepID=UPI0027145AB2|nr:restriction endonuclease subunit S [Bradyrhizobium japonicum]WLB24974.1 restriction endonuclease subunit S [Bradyrhizobium japonicum]